MQAFGWPGIAPTWASSGKDAVTTALGPSRLWATIGYGIVNEVFWPETGEPQIRDLGFILARDGAWVELKRAQCYSIALPRPYIPLATLTHVGDDYRFTLQVLPDPLRDVLLLRWLVEGDYRAYALLAPHLGGTGTHNTAWVDGDLLYARNGATALCLRASDGFTRASAGYVGASDGWQDFHHNGRMTWTFDQASDGNVALMGELPGKSGALALGFANLPEGAATLAASSLSDGVDDARQRFVAGWQAWGGSLRLPAPTPELGVEAQLSACVLRVHEDRTYPGAIVASLSTPWGSASDSLGGYHLVWTRDCCESALALLAAGQREDAERVLEYLIATQLPDGHWTQNFYPDGRPFWVGVQLDETAFPILLAARLAEDGDPPVSGLPRMIVRAASYIARMGPLSPQDRWEESAGANPFTMAVEVAALVAAAQWLEGSDRDYALALADCWNDRIEDCCWVADTPLARRFGVVGYYVRVQPPGSDGGAEAPVAIANRMGETLGAGDLVGLEFMYLARTGLRKPKDPRIVETLRVVDGLLLVDTPCGPVYHRYNADGYGEHADGSPFDGTGVGRAWPLLSGERGHLALLQGEDPLPYLERMLCCAGPGGLLPEQVWDSDPIPHFGLEPGRPSGSAMPLVWAHAEFLKLLVARTHGRPFELLHAVEERYHGERPDAPTWFWRASAPFGALPAGKALVIEDETPFLLHYGFMPPPPPGTPAAREWQRPADREADYLGLGMWGVRLEPGELAGARTLLFTRRYGANWEQRDWQIALRGGGG